MGLPTVFLQAEPSPQLPCIFVFGFGLFVFIVDITTFVLVVADVVLLVSLCKKSEVIYFDVACTACYPSLDYS